MTAPCAARGRNCRTKDRLRCFDRCSLTMNRPFPAPHYNIPYLVHQGIRSRSGENLRLPPNWPVVLSSDSRDFPCKSHDNQGIRSGHHCSPNYAHSSQHRARASGRFLHTINFWAGTRQGIARPRDTSLFLGQIDAVPLLPRPVAFRAADPIRVGCVKLLQALERAQLACSATFLLGSSHRRPRQLPGTRHEAGT